MATMRIIVSLYFSSRLRMCLGLDYLANSKAICGFETKSCLVTFENCLAV